MTNVIEILGAKELVLYSPESSQEYGIILKDPRAFKIDIQEIVFCNITIGNKFIILLLKNGFLMHIELWTFEDQKSLYNEFLSENQQFVCEAP